MTNDEKMDFLVEQMGTVIGRLDSMDKRFDSMDERLDSMDEKLNSMDDRLGLVEKSVKDMHNDLTNVHLQIENELIPDIKRIAEGHLDLDRKLREVIKTNTDYEMLVLRVNHLETKVDILEQKIS